MYIYHVKRVSPREAGSGGRKRLGTQKHTRVSHTQAVQFLYGGSSPHLSNPPTNQKKKKGTLPL